MAFGLRTHKMEDYIGIEKVVHGLRWGALHNGYFSDPTVARPLVNVAIGVLAKSQADVIVDLGGGTGFLLSQLASKGVCAAAALMDVDCSEAQLALIDGATGISPVRVPIEDFRRSDVATEDQRLFLMMRSVLHYLGENGLLPLLRHLRDQAKEGEFFVHQSASFENEEEAACLNALYRHMRTLKWYPTVNDLKRRLVDSGWRVTDTISAPSLLLTSDDLSQRYALDARYLAHIRDMMAIEFGGMNSIFRLTPSGFNADLHYQIFTCVATSHGLPDTSQIESNEPNHCLQATAGRIT